MKTTIATLQVLNVADATIERLDNKNSAKGIQIHEASCKPSQRIFTVVTVSTNTNSFGYKGVCLLCEDGAGFECLYQAYGTEPVPARGDKLTEDKLSSYCRRTLPATTPAKAKKILASL